MELALGTVQFGLDYGVAGRGAPVPEDEVRQILRRASQLGIRVIDTAQAYGDIQARLAGLAPDGAFGIVTKLPPLPRDLLAAEAGAWAVQALQRAKDELGSALHAVLFHRGEDLLESRGAVLWERCSNWAAASGCSLGISCYDPDTLRQVRERYPVAIAQLPGNAFDQRLSKLHLTPEQPLQVHVRSAFLQGLLLMQEAEAARRVPRAAKALAAWHDWLRKHSLRALPAALGFVKALKGATHCVVGVDGLEQLEQVAAAWDAAAPLHADALAVDDLQVIDPRHWPPRT